MNSESNYGLNYEDYEEEFQILTMNISEQQQKISEQQQKISELQQKNDQQTTMNQAFQNQLNQLMAQNHHFQNQLHCIMATYQNPQDYAEMPSDSNSSANKGVIAESGSPIHSITSSPRMSPKNSRAPSVINEPKGNNDNTEWGDVKYSPITSPNDSIDEDDEVVEPEPDTNTVVQNFMDSYAEAASKDPEPQITIQDPETNQSTGKELTEYCQEVNPYPVSGLPGLIQLIEKHNIHIDDIQKYAPIKENTIYFGIYEGYPVVLATIGLYFKLFNIEKSQEKCYYGMRCTNFKCNRDHGTDKGYPPNIGKCFKFLCLNSFLGFNNHPNCLKDPDVFHCRIKDIEGKVDCPPGFYQSIFQLPKDKYTEDSWFGCTEV